MNHIEKYREGLVCLVPREDSDSVITSHERTLCDCQVLEIFAELDWAQLRIEKLRKALDFYSSKKNYEFDHTHHNNYIWNDQGLKAREVLIQDDQLKGEK